ncbi:MAG: hypothetical protein IPF99_33510 [Deltaproteobacteria bacterium]|nr:hypothetical protein [Deltaproteobacteria bacterium]MBP6834039.1 hypothetical protein [Deltaproteobacteria bacterium]
MRALTLGMGTRAAAALALGWCLAHCKRRETHEAAPTTHAAQPSTATAAPAPAPAPAPAQTPSATPEAAAPVVDLLRATEAVVRVSSAVDNPNDRPERLVDGDPDTAWSSATGEMERTWMEVRLPPDARVERMEMTAGYTRAGGRTDLFTGNVRVARVRVLRDGAVVGEYPLDVASRALQPVPARGAGGLWRIETVGLVPGTRRAWREVTVSELRVMGVAGRTGLRATPAAPAVAVGPESPAGGAAPSAADGGSLSMALDAARRELLGEGLNPEQGETGCSGGFAEHCVRSHWMALASGAVDYAVARCPAVARRDVDRRYRTLSRLQDRVSAAIDRGEDDSALGASADEALDALCAAAADAAEACPAATGLAPLAPILRARDTAALGRYRVTP